MTPAWTHEFEDAHWPFLGRDEIMAQCLDFLAPYEADGPSRQLDVSGLSGIGKSLFVKELLLRFAQAAPHSICLYQNIESSDLESAELEKRLFPQLSHAHVPNRTKPVNVPREVVPHELEVAVRRSPDGWLWQDLIEEAAVRPVVLAIDNVQFLSGSARGELERVLPAAKKGFRFVAVERLASELTPPVSVTCFPERRWAQTIGPLDMQNACRLVCEILGDDVRLEEICRKLYTSSQGNPKRLWIQLRAIMVKRRYGSERRVTVGDYEETVRDLSGLEILALRTVTFLKGGLRLDDLVAALRMLVEPLDDAEAKIRESIAILVLIGLLIVNGTGRDRVRPEHELVETSVRLTTTTEERLALRQPTIDALMSRLRHYTGAADEYDRLVETLVDQLLPVEVRARTDYRAHLIGLIDRHRKRENYRALATLYPRWEAIVSVLPAGSLIAFLDAFLKTMQFDEGIAAVAQMRSEGSALTEDQLGLAEAKFLVQKFDYDGAKRFLQLVKPTSESTLLRFNIHLNRCEDDEARSIVEAIRVLPRELDEFECAILRNSNHLYDAVTARAVLARSRAGFERLGRNMGVATSLNNLGIVDLWARNNEAARSNLEAAVCGLEAIGSAEAYQPLANLATLHALEGRYGDARSLFEKASVTLVRRQLAMDDLMLSFNCLVLDVAAGRRGLEDAATEAASLHRASLRNTEDYRFQQTLAWFANELARHTNAPTVASAFDARFRNNGASGLEVFSSVVVEGRAVELVFVLSPHWRY